MYRNYHIVQVEPRNHRNSGIYILSSHQHLHSLFLLYWLHHQHPELSRCHVIYSQQHLSFQNTLNNLHNFVCSLRASISHIQLYHNANALNGDSFSTRSDGTIGQPQRKVEGNCWGKIAEISYKLTLLVGSGLYNGIHLGTHQWTHTDINCSWCPGWEGMGHLSWYNHSWSSHRSPPFTIAADVAAPQEQVFAFSGVGGTLPLIYGVNIWQNPWPNGQFEVW